MVRLNENLREHDLKYCVSNFISVDEYVSKIDDDNITIAFFCNDNEIVSELKDFIEKAFFIEIKDIEIADTITEDNKYILFVELERSIYFPKLLLNMLKSISFLTDDNKWSFTTLKHHHQMPCNEENIKKFVRLTKLRNTPEIGDEVELKDESEDEVKESKEVLFLVNKDGYCTRLINEGYISEEKMMEYIRKSKRLNSLDTLTESLLEERFLGKEIISTDDKIFILDDDKILMLS